MTGGMNSLLSIPGTTTVSPAVPGKAHECRSLQNFAYIRAHAGPRVRRDMLSSDELYINACGAVGHLATQIPMLISLSNSASALGLDSYTATSS